MQMFGEPESVIVAAADENIIEQLQIEHMTPPAGYMIWTE